MVEPNRPNLTRTGLTAPKPIDYPFDMDIWPNPTVSESSPILEPIGAQPKEKKKKQKYLENPRNTYKNINKILKEFRKLFFPLEIFWGSSQTVLKAKIIF